MKNVVVLGSTGSIGKQVLEVIRGNPGDFKIAGLSAHKNVKLLQTQIEEFKPKYGGTTDRKVLEKLVEKKDIDIVVFACSGTDYLPVLYKAIRAGKNIAMANKEMIVEDGEKIIKEVKINTVQFIPIDSEHSGIFQCIQGRKRSDIEKVILTCSGGPFLKTPLNALKNVTAKDAVKHPVWKMGKKISIDSATLMNKALEIIEAKYLFDLKPEQIEVLIHPQCLVHALVQFKDGNIIAHFGYPDMKIPISYALYYPYCKQNMLQRIDLADKKLEFFSPDIKKFPSIQFAYKALSLGGTYPKRLNRANNKAVELFLNDEIGYLDIFKLIEKELFKK